MKDIPTTAPKVEYIDCFKIFNFDHTIVWENENLLKFLKLLQSSLLIVEDVSATFIKEQNFTQVTYQKMAMLKELKKIVKNLTGFLLNLNISKQREGSQDFIIPNTNRQNLLRDHGFIPYIIRLIDIIFPNQIALQLIKKGASSK